MRQLSSIFLAFIKKLLIFTVILSLVLYTGRYFLPIKWNTPALPYLLPFFFIVNAMVHYVLLKASLKKFSRFVNYYLAGSFLKLMLYIIVLLLYVFNNKADALPFTILFFILYLSFTAFEIMSLLRNNNSSPGKE